MHKLNLLIGDSWMVLRALSVLAVVGFSVFTVVPSVYAFEQCPTAPPALKTLDTRSHYSDPKWSIVDEQKLAEAREAGAPLRQFLGDLIKVSDAYVRSGDPDARECGLSLLRAWARDEGLFGGKFSHQGKHVRAWALSSIAISYIKLGALEERDPEIDAWLNRIAGAVIYFEKTKRAEGRGIDNKDYWMALAVGATGLILDRSDYWDFAKKIYDIGVDHIQPDGTLPAELRRGQMASRYHAFAAAALVTIARLGVLQGEDLFAEDDAKLCTLVDLVLETVKEPQLLRHVADAEQLTNGRPYWLPLAVGCPAGQEAIGSGSKFGGTQNIGGSVDNLRTVLEQVSLETLH